MFGMPAHLIHVYGYYKIPLPVSRAIAYPAGMFRSMSVFDCALWFVCWVKIWQLGVSCDDGVVLIFSGS